MNSIQYGNRNISYEIKKGNRIKTVAIHINPTGYITVLSPQSLDEESIQKILYKRGKWIIGKQELIDKNRDANIIKQFVSGESFPYLGRYYRLKVTKPLREGEKKCRLINGRIFVEGNGNSTGENRRSSVKRALIEWCVEHGGEK